MTNGQGRALAGLFMMAACCPAFAAQPAPANGHSQQLVGEAIAKAERLNPQLNAIIAIDPSAMDAARLADSVSPKGPLHGQPVLIKDNIETAGPLPTTAGSLALAANVTGRDAPLVAKLRANGAIILGKANLSEWANIRSSSSISGWSAIGDNELVVLLTELKADKEVSSRLTASELDSMFDDAYHLKHVETIFARVFGSA